MMYQKINYFLGSNTAYGYQSRFNELQKIKKDEKLFILKGSAGCGKSTFMKKTAEYFGTENHNMEFILCGVCPNSLDSVIIPHKHITLADGTAPHILEPIYPITYENVIDLNKALNMKKLDKYYNQIIRLNIEIDSYYKNVIAYIKSAVALLKNNIIKTENYVSDKNANDFVFDFMDRIKLCKKGETKKRLLSVVSTEKIVFLSGTIKALCDEIIVLNDDFGALKNKVLKKIANYSTDLGLEHIECLCSVMGDNTIDHIIFPSIKLAITTSDYFHDCSGFATESISDLIEYEKNISLFEDAEKDALFVQQLLSKASYNIFMANSKHNFLENIYNEAMDFSITDRIFENTIEKINLIF